MDRDIARIEQRLSAPTSRTPPYTPPSIADLITRIDAALRERRAA